MKPQTPSHVHLIGVGGTAMGALAGMLKAVGWRVTGSDGPLYPPMSDQLAAWGIEVMQGFEPAHLDPAPDLVVVGNVCRRDNPEAAAARDACIPFVSLPRALHDYFLAGRKPLVVAGTHGKTTTTSLLGELLEAARVEPSVLAGGVMKRWGSNFKLGAGAWFAIEGDEYDSAYFEKSAKFLQYAPFAAIITSVEYDHADIYPDFDAYLQAFVRLAELIPADGRLVLWSGVSTAPALRAVCKAEVITYGVAGDPDADWMASPTSGGALRLIVRGQDQGVWRSELLGLHNLRNGLAALAMAHEVAGVDLETLRNAIPSCVGVKRRQELLGAPHGIRVYDDFGHHPTAVRETLLAMRAAYPASRIAAAFEPRSATACRRSHQDAYASSFDAVDLAILAPVGRNLAADERLDTAGLAVAIRKRGIEARAAASLDEVVSALKGWAKAGDVIVLMSNGSFGGVANRLLKEL